MTSPYTSSPRATITIPTFCISGSSSSSFSLSSVSTGSSFRLVSQDRDIVGLSDPTLFTSTEIGNQVVFYVNHPIST